MGLLPWQTLLGFVVGEVRPHTGNVSLATFPTCVRCPHCRVWESAADKSMGKQRWGDAFVHIFPILQVRNMTNIGAVLTSLERCTPT
mmetsp:Transcript_24992/g.42788  ORF Transcript_24992/g.42788 Transcript_24992/m.42788 type:complete len:87 (+) Transcript_24992:3450-3710(+)